jgi:hypothetical protein
LLRQRRAWANQIESNARSCQTIPQTEGEIMFNRIDLYTKCVLAAIAVVLCVIALRAAASPHSVVAATADYSYLYAEPGVTTLRKPDGTEQVQGKVFIDMRNGDVWGFPTLSGAPYPVDTTSTQPPVSTPMYLGKFDFSKTTRR